MVEHSHGWIIVPEAANVIESLESKPERVQVILTGCKAHLTIVDRVHRVSETRRLRHA